MLIAKRTLYSRLTQCTNEERDWLAEYLSFEGEKRGGGKFQAARIQLFNRLNNTYPAGFDTLVERAAPAEGFEVKFVDAREPPVERDPHADLAWLRDYQLDTLNALIAAKRGIAWLPTGAGKTEIIVALTRALPTTWLALVHRSQLADDIASRYERRTPGMLAGRVIEGRWEVPEDATLICMTYQSAQSGLKRGAEKGLQDEQYIRVKHLLGERAKGLITDESHTIPAESFYRIVMQTKSAYYRAAFSGTPLARGDKKSMYQIGAMGPIAHRIRPQLLIDRGILARPTVRMITCTQASNAVTWHGVESQLIIKSAKRNSVLLEAAKRATRPALLFVNKVEHGKALSKLLTNAGIPSDFVWGSHSLDYRKSMIKRLVQGHFEVLVCSTVFNEGIDIPELRSVIVGAGGKSLIAVFQRMGRGMRIDRAGDGTVREGGSEFEVWDILDKGNKWTERHANLRKGAFVSEAYKTIVEPEPHLKPTVRKARDTITRATEGGPYDAKGT